MINYDSERMELSTRDIVAMANYTEISEGRGTPNGGVYLDIKSTLNKSNDKNIFVHTLNYLIHLLYNHYPINVESK